MTEEEIIILNEYVVYVFIGSYKKNVSNPAY